jgi:uncharacterized membrane protein
VILPLVFVVVVGQVGRTPELGPAPAVAAVENPLARSALDAFENKCVQCHGLDVPHPKAGFGFVTDLRRLVASEKYVVPGSLERSRLWSEIDEGDMPPDEARAGPLTAVEKNAIRRWIVGGAPALDAASGQELALSMATPEPRAASTPKPAQVTGREHEIHPAPDTFLGRAVVLVGRAHVILVHFPIALLLVAALTEAWGALRRSAAVPTSSRLLLGFGAIGAAAAAGLGWIHALDGFAGPFSSPISTTGLHRWIGVTVAVAAPAIALLAERDAARGTRTAGVRWAIVGLGVGTGLAAHFGGLLTHGAEYFSP